MSKRLYPILFVALMASLVLPRVVSPLKAQELDERLKIDRVRAQDDQEQNSRFSERLRDLQEERGARVEERVESRTEAREERRADVLEKRTDNYEEIGSKLQLRFSLYKTRLVIIMDKLQSRVERMKAAGKDTSEAEAKLNEAKVLFDDASETGNAAIQIFTSIQAGDLSAQQSEIDSGKEKAQLARQMFAEVMQLLKETIQIVRTL